MQKQKYNNNEIFNNNSTNLNANKNNKKRKSPIKDNKNTLISSYTQAYKFCKNIKEINKQNEKGYTPVYCSILSGNIEALNDLLLFGADPNIPNFLGETPLYLSVNEKNLDCLFLLLKYNADCNIQTKKGNTPLHLAVQKNFGNLIQILLRNNANPNIKNKSFGQTATHLAIINRLDEDILKLLKECNADIFKIKDKYNKTAFDYAKDSNDEYYIHLLIKIFKNNNNSFNDNKYIEKHLQTWNDKAISNNFIIGKNDMNSNYFNENNILNYSERYKYSYNLDKNNNILNKINNDKIQANNNYLLHDKTNKNEFKIDDNSFNSSNKNNENNKASDKNIYTHGRAFVSSDLCSNNIQIKELNNSSECNSMKSKKSLSGFFEDEINNIDIITYKPNSEDINNNNNKENINYTNLVKNTNNEAYTIKTENSNNSEIKINRNFRNSENSNNSNIINNRKYINNNFNFSHSSSNNTNKSNNTYNSQNLNQSNSICANRKIIKGIINDTVKKIVVKTISSSEVVIMMQM